MRLAAKRDTNEREVIAALELAGWKVLRLSQANWPDLLCVRGGTPQRAGKVRLVEVKTPKGKLRPGQVEFFRVLEAVGLPVAVVRSAADARAVET